MSRSPKPVADPVADGEPPDAAGARVRELWEQRTRRRGRHLPAISLGGRRVLTLESRRSPELALLVMNYGGTPVIAPAVREVPLDSHDHVVAFAGDVIRGHVDLLVLLTGVGVRMMLKAIEPVPGRAAFLDALGRTRLVARGPKPVAALREVGLAPWATAPSPNTWRELLATLDERRDEAPLSGARVAIQEYGSENPDLVLGLRARGASVTTVSIYRWALPETLEPLRRAVWALLRGEIDIVVLTASIQLVHLLRVADQMGLEALMRRALKRTVIASVGPMTSEELVRQGLPIDFEPSHPKMGFLIKEMAEQCEALDQAKQGVESPSEGAAT
jgi:uroporphyrinogen-III synthase